MAPETNQGHAPGLGCGVITRRRIYFRERTCPKGAQLFLRAAQIENSAKTQSCLPAFGFRWRVYLPCCSWGHQPCCQNWASASCTRMQEQKLPRIIRAFLIRLRMLWCLVLHTGHCGLLVSPACRWWTLTHPVLIMWVNLINSQWWCIVILSLCSFGEPRHSYLDSGVSFSVLWL